MSSGRWILHPRSRRSSCSRPRLYRDSISISYPVPVQTDRARSRLEQMVEALASRGHRVTPQRLAILEFRDAANRYDGNMPEPHPHLVCTRCGRIDEVMSPSLHETASRVADEVGYELLSHRFDVYGLCPSCREELHRDGDEVKGGAVVR